jgi:hypothetical protein
MAIRPRIVCSACVALLGLAAPAHGLGLLADDRFSRREVTPGPGDYFFEPDSFFGPFDVPGQSSAITVTSDGLGLDGFAVGSASGSHDDNGNFYGSESVFSIGFRIDGEGTLALDGCFESSNDAVPGSGSVRVLAGDTEVFSRPAVRGEPCLFDVFDFDDDLTAGAYTLEARAHHAGTDSGIRFELAFQVRDTAHPIPEPSTFATLAAGLAWLGRRRKAHGDWRTT